jgi:cytochrome bd-type quinol oxidase subunit 2
MTMSVAATGRGWENDMRRAVVYVLALLLLAYLGYVIGISLATMNHVPLTDENVQTWIKIPVPATIIVGLAALTAFFRRRDARRRAAVVMPTVSSWPTTPPPPAPPSR